MNDNLTGSVGKAVFDVNTAVDRGRGLNPPSIDKISVFKRVSDPTLDAGRDQIDLSRIPANPVNPSAADAVTAKIPICIAGLDGAPRRAKCFPL